MAKNTKAKRTRQTQLEFAPLPSSASAKESQPDAVRRRAAAVTIADSKSPAKTTRTSREYLPTPTPSSQIPRDSRQADAPTPRRASRSFAASQSKFDAPSNGTISNSWKQHLNILDISDESESDTPVMQSSPTRKARKSTKNSTQARDEVDSLSSSENDVPRSSKRRKVMILSDSDNFSASSQINDDKKTSASEDEEEDEDGLPVRRNRRGRQTSTAKPPKRKNMQDQADLDEDLEFLGDADVDSPRAMRQRGVSAMKTAKQRALDALKARRLHRADTTRQSGSIKEDDNSDSDQAVEDGSNQDVDEPLDSDFIVEDDSEDALGGPVELPFQFSQYRTMKPKELFKFVVEWMVQKKINPAFDMQDEVYQIAFDRLDDFVRGMGGSKFHSSAWTPAFSRMLKSRPTLEDHQYEAGSLLRDRCDACNRSGHPATWEVRFTGQTYDRSTLEEDSEDDEDDEDADDAGEETAVFYIGKFCMRNARTAHALAHWKYHLKEWIVDYLKNKGELTPEKIVRRDGWNTSRRRKDAERIVGEMEAVGEIKNLHRDFKAEISEAHFAQDYSGRDGTGYLLEA